MKEDRPILALDFDGCIHKYSNGWQGGVIYDIMMPGFLSWAVEANKHFALYIYSSRSETEEGREAMRTWMRDQLRERLMPADIQSVLGMFTFCDHKPPAFLTIDDRAIQFPGDWTSPDLNPQHLKAFKPWMQRINNPKTNNTPDDKFAAFVCLTPVRHNPIMQTIAPTADEAWRRLRSFVSEPDKLQESGYSIATVMCSVMNIIER